MKKSVGTIRLELAQYREMQVFSQFGGDLDEQTIRDLRYGAGLMQLLRQQNHSPLSLWQQVVLLTCAREKMFIDIPVKEIGKCKDELLGYFQRSCGAICLRIEHGKTYSDELKKGIIADAKKFFDERSR